MLTKPEVTNCFYALYGLTDTLDRFREDLAGIRSTGGQIRWFNVVAYDPIHIFGDLSVIWEYCELYAWAD